MNLKSTLLIILSTLSITAIAQKPKVAVYVTGDEDIRNIVGNRLVDGLAHNGKYTAVERTASFLKALSAEHGYQRSGEVDDSQIAELGKQFGVQYVCVASIATVWGDEKYFAAHIIDVQTAEVVATGSSSGRLSSSSDLIGVLNGLSGSLLKALDYSKNANAKKVAVYVTRTGNRDVDIIFGDQLVAGFAKSGKYLAIERTKRFLTELSKETNYQQSGAVDDEDLVRLGRQMGVQYICVANTDKAYGDYFLTSRLIDVKSAEVVNSHNAEGKKLNSSQNVVAVATEIAQKLSGRTIAEEGEYYLENQAILKKLGFVDLGLSVYWKDHNEPGGLYTYDVAVSRTKIDHQQLWVADEVERPRPYIERPPRFHGNIPTKEQFEELKSKCSWTWTGSGYKVTGPNGNSITLPAEGCRGCDGDVHSEGSYGSYWSSTPNGSEFAWRLGFDSGGVYVFGNYRCSGLSVRLVQEK